ncbi:lipid-A-disaccharide synthase N-terminal domain-containing protein [Aliiroseovarius subalbicans]|uniref:lipid-A-disaccharide synthase N-terminal domain-containing protein n=1 Tax=Aliiroseovarius subalbicans TaxID=2925840 RepID=UPI001F58006D|nr:lipid-A-disaccharide synthase N-terminal domain-containing protein [Aliiroseovarius subalbicans]MCI2400677.1 lipid-A-disaccharide synthase N-terminal domain-containing protein [Aliiroseovarius subalbicans]
MQPLLEYLGVETTLDAWWLVIGIGAQAMFTMRFLIQWYASEKAGESVVPTLFWWFSIFGGATLLAYGVYRGEIVIIMGQSLGLLIYVRNLMLIYRKPGPGTDSDL